MELKKGRDYSLKNGCISLTHNGKKTITEIEKTTGVLEIPEGVIEIPDRFLTPSMLKKLVLPDSLKIIGVSAFENGEIDEIIGGKNVEIIRKFAFRSNILIKVYSFKNLQKIEFGAFHFNKLEDFYFPNTLKVVEERAFLNNNLTKVDLSKCKHLIIKEDAFSENRINELIVDESLILTESSFDYNELEKENIKGKALSLKYPNIRKPVEYEDARPDNSWEEKHFIIENGAFVDLSKEGYEKIEKSNNLTFPEIHGVNKMRICFSSLSEFRHICVKEVYLSEGITEIGDYAFGYLPVEKVHFPKSLETIGVRAFEETEIISAKIEGNLKEIGAGAFRESSIEAVDIKDTKVSEIPSYAFFNCNILRKVKLPKNLEHITESAFERTTSLFSIKFPKTLRNIGGNVFLDAGLREVEFEEDSEFQEFGCSAFENCRISTIPFEKMKYLEIIGAYTFMRNNLKKVHIKNAEMVCSKSFGENYIEKIKIENVDELSQLAFSCNPIEDCEISENVEFMKEKWE